MSAWRRWYTDRLLSRVILCIVCIGSAVVLAIASLSLGPALRAAQGKRTRALFIARTKSCDTTCSWTGTFTSGRGKVLPDVAYDDSLPASARPGSTFPALYPAARTRSSPSTGPQHG